MTRLVPLSTWPPRLPHRDHSLTGARRRGPAKNPMGITMHNNDRQICIRAEGGRLTAPVQPARAPVEPLVLCFSNITGPSGLEEIGATDEGALAVARAPRSCCPPSISKGSLRLLPFHVPSPPCGVS